MSQPSHFPQVIQRVIERNADKGLTPAQLAEAIVDGLDLAEAILGDGPVASLSKPFHRPPQGQEPVLIKTGSEPQYPIIYRDAAIPIDIPTTFSEEAPPPAMVRNPNGTVTQDTYAEAEIKKNAIVADAMQKLPPALSVELSDIGVLVLNKYVKRSPEGMDSVRILFALQPDDEDGPQVQILTHNPTVDWAVIRKEIEAQARGRYRKAPPKITPRQPQTQGFPDIDNMKFTASAADLLPASQEEVDEWRRLNPNAKI